jgi:hypothetical protein
MPSAPGPTEVAGNRMSCGPISLATLLSLRGRHVDPALIESRLGKRESHSLAELRDAAASFGLASKGVRIAGKRWTVRLPAIVLMQRRGAGHFAVLRAVGHSGQLVQIIEATYEVAIVDAGALLGSASWTGMALIEVNCWEERRLLLAFVAGSLVVAMGIGSHFYRRMRSSGSRGWQSSGDKGKTEGAAGRGGDSREQSLAIGPGLTSQAVVPDPHPSQAFC